MPTASELSTTATDELKRNILQIAHGHAFLGGIGLGVPLIPSPHIPTICTDSEAIYVNPNLLEIEPFNDPAVRRFSLAHVILHRSLNHPFRLPAPHDPAQINFPLWVMAQDIVVNNLLLSLQTARVGAIRSREARDKELRYPLFRPPRDENGDMVLTYDPVYSGWSAERIYVDLIGKSKDEIKAIARGSLPTKGKSTSKGKEEVEYKHKPVEEVPVRWDGRLDSHIYYDPTAPEAKDAMSRCEIEFLQAVSQSKSHGSGTGDALRKLSSEMGSDPTLDAALHEILVAMEIGEYSWERPQRRWIPQDLYFPGPSPDKGAHLVIGIDVSGSIGQKELHEFWMIVRGLLQGGHKLTFDIIACDAAITSVHHVSWDEPDSFELIKNLEGGGGTDFRPVFDWAQENVPDADAVIFFTDLCGTFPETPTECPTFWLVDCALRGHMNPPFGTTIFYLPSQLSA